MQIKLFLNLHESILLPMKKNAPLMGFIVAAGVMVLAFIIYFLFLAKKNEYLVDNPTAQTYFFTINNGEEKIITSGQYVKVDLKRGEINSIKVFDDQKKLLYDSAFKVTQYRGLLNITHGDYYVHRQFYGYVPNKDSLLMSSSFEIDGKRYPGHVSHQKKLFLEDFYYNLNEDYDPIIKNIDKLESRTKIYRKQDFLDFYQENYK